MRYSEIGLKSAPVRRRFENQLKDNMLSMLMEDGVEALVTKNGARYYVEATDPDAAVASLRRVFGVGSISVAEECDSSRMEDICSKAAAIHYDFVQIQYYVNYIYTQYIC